MSHIFVSYAHTDKTYLDQFVAWSRENGFAERELWYDQHIEGGNNWRDEIASALDEAFAVVVIVTTNSVKSLYCTFEWAYALGQGIPVLPLVFDNISITDVPTPLTSKQFTNCKEGIADTLKEQIHQLRTTPPHIEAINTMIYEAIYNTHQRFFILGWLGDELKSLDHESREYLIEYFVKEATEAHQKLKTLMLEKANIFSGRQYRFCWKIIDFLYQFSRLPYKIDTHLQGNLFPQFNTTWLPMFEYFEGEKRRRRRVYDYFEWGLENEDTRTQIFAEIIKVFPILDGYNVSMLLDNKRIDQQRKSSGQD